MTEVIGIKFEENGAVEYVVPDKNYTKGDFVVVWFDCTGKESEYRIIRREFGA